MHRYHPDPTTGDQPDAILFDHCEGCAAKADSLGLGLDRHNFGAMWSRMVAVEYRYQCVYASETEARLGSALFKVSLLVQRSPIVVQPIPEGQLSTDA